MNRVGTPADDAGAELHVAVRFVVAEIGIRFGGKVPADLDSVLRYYVSVHYAFMRAARHVVTMAKVYGIDGDAR